MRNVPSDSGRAGIATPPSLSRRSTSPRWFTSISMPSIFGISMVSSFSM